MRRLTAYGAHPAFQESEWQERDPKNVPRVEAPNLHRPACLPARQAIVIAKGNAFAPEVVDAIDEDHRGSDFLLHSKSAGILYPTHLPGERQMILGYDVPI
jgi:hypothetical protein